MKKEDRTPKIKAAITIAVDSDIDENALFEKGEKLFNQIDKTIKEAFPTCTILGHIEIMKYRLFLTFKWDYRKKKGDENEK